MILGTENHLPAGAPRPISAVNGALDALFERTNLTLD
jgi:hypothetical protein